MPNLRDWQLAIRDRLAEQFTLDRVFEEGVPELKLLPHYPGGVIKPYVAIWHGQRIDGGPGFGALDGVLNSAHRVPFYVEVGAATGSMCLDAAQAVRDLLTGFRPAGQGELREDGAPTIRQPLDMSGVISRYQIPIAFNGIVDL